MNDSVVVISSDGSTVKTLTEYLIETLGKIMATQQEIQAAVAELAESVSDYTLDVTAKLQQLATAQTAMTATIDRLSADDASDKALIQQLRDQLAAQTTGTDAILAEVRNLNDAIKKADVVVDQG